MDIKHIIGLLIYASGALLCSSCDYTLAKSSEVAKPQLEVVCYHRDGKALLQMVADDVARDDGVLRVIAPQGARDVTIDVTGDPVCVVIAGKMPNGARPPSPPSPPSTPVKEDSVDAGPPPADAGSAKP